jgi:hypothetical protein
MILSAFQLWSAKNIRSLLPSIALSWRFIGNMRLTQRQAAQKQGQAIKNP